MFDFLKPDRTSWRHYFGGLAFLVLILQLLSGVYLTFFYDPSPGGAYKSVQYISNELFGGSLLRNLHRWIAFSALLFVVVHAARSTVRKEFLHGAKKVEWTTGALLILPVFLFVVTGLILPWEWKGYWFMEMVPNYAAVLPVVGPDLKPFLIQSFTLPRYLVIHILILPVAAFILIDYHFLTRLRKRGVFRYIARHLVITVPFIAGLAVLAVYVTMPTEDPDMMSMPLDGEYIPAPEWYGLLVLLPFMYFKGALVALFSVYLPVFMLLAFAFLPFFFGKKTAGEDAEDQGQRAHRATGLRLAWHRLWRGGLVTKTVRFALVTIIAGAICSLIYLGSYNSPTLGCSSCHNLSRGMRMGVPPEVFKDRQSLPNLEDNEWMMGHWFYPTEIY